MKMRNGRAINDVLKDAFNAGAKYERGERESEDSYNRFTGYQKPNMEDDFDTWLRKQYKTETVK